MRPRGFSEEKKCCQAKRILNTLVVFNYFYAEEL